MKNKIFIEVDEKISDVLAKIKKSKLKAITLVVPKKAKMFAKSALTKLADETAKNKQEITIQSNDTGGIAAAAALNINTIDPNQAVSSAVSSAKPKKSQKIKIVYKKGAKKKTTKTPPAPKIMAGSQTSAVSKDKPKADVVKEKPNLASQILFGVLSIISIVIIFAVILLIIPKTDINITAQSQSVPLVTTITIDSAQSNIDFINNVIPGQLLTISKEITIEERATGEHNQGTRASGTITVHNEGSAEVPLVNNTRFLSADNVLFRTTSAVKVPGKGTAQVNVLADIAGEAGNIGASKFTLPALPGSQTYLYGRSSGSMSGGTDIISYEITEEDIRYSNDEIAARILEEAIIELQNKLPSDRRYLSVSAAELVLDIQADAQVGDRQDTFNVIAKSTVPFLVYDEKDLAELVSRNSAKLVSGQKTIAPESLANLEMKIVSLDTVSNMAVVDVSATAITIPEYNLDTIRNDLTGRSTEEVKEYFLDYPEIQQIEIEFWPDWVNRVSKIPSRIAININY